MRQIANIDDLILASLKDGVKNGKEIISELNTEFGFLWQAKTSMIYPALRKLQNRGLIRKNEEKTNDVTITSIYYELTEKGLQQLKEFNKPPLPFFQNKQFKPPSLPFKRFHFWEKFVDTATIAEQLMSYKKHLIKELKRIDEKITELGEMEEYKDAFHDID